MKKTLSILAIAGLILALAPAAQAAIIEGDTSTAENEDGTRPAANICNDNGLTGDAPGGTLSSPWTNGWQGFIGANPMWARVDLGATYTVDTMYVWAYHEQATNRGMKDTNIYYSTDVNADATDFSGTEWSLFGAKTMAPGTWTNEPVTDTVDLGGLTARIIAIEILNSQDGGTAVGIGKLQFDGTAVPEPATMSLLAIGGIALIRRRRRA